jgi:hypothetical protein
MAAAIKALNAKIRSNPYTDYLCSTRECLSLLRLFSIPSKLPYDALDCAALALLAD